MTFKPHMYDKSPVVKGDIARWYAKNYSKIEDDIENVFEPLDTPFLDKKIKPNMKVLDAMMGQGRHAIRYAKRGSFVWGNDFNVHMVERAMVLAKKAKLDPDKMRFSCKDARNLKNVPKNFDVTIAMFSAVGTVPKSKNRQQIMNTLAKHTKKGGIVIVHAHNRLDSFIEKDFVIWAFKNVISPDDGLERGDMIADYNGLESMFNHFYTPGEFRKSFRLAGLKVVEENYMNYTKKKFISGPLRKFKADGFIFVGKKK